MVDIAVVVVVMVWLYIIEGEWTRREISAHRFLELPRQNINIRCHFIQIAEESYYLNFAGKQRSVQNALNIIESLVGAINIGSMLDEQLDDFQISILDSKN
ncbi:hypothetical protein KQX54_001993 [Cotesia glomerata]|uniref:Uncharacterized protein n=1 Tax=Cotesia glomerata TaxID=32391 RepID=A0AAV7HWG4_COTGL|nr:hypothetical protein KQX54_001993 [Cotesia glomerata]